MSGSLVSVVMATYGGDNIHHLKEAVDSILTQSHSELELIIVVDGAIPSSQNDYFNRTSSDVRVKVIHLEVNQGPSAARNVGIEIAEGQYIAIMDADDVSLPDRIEHQLKYLNAHQLDVMSSALVVIDDDGKSRGIRRLPIDEGAVRSLAPYRCPLHNPAAFGKASIFKSYRYDATLRVSEDYDLWVRLLLDNRRLGNSAEACVLYRQSAAATAKRIGLKYAIADFKVKTSALRISSNISKPFVLCFAALSSCVRLLPHRPFAMLYAYRMQEIK